MMALNLQNDANEIEWKNDLLMMETESYNCVTLNASELAVFVCL